MGVVSQSIRVANAIYSSVAAGEFFPRLRDKDTRLVSLGVTAVQPSGVVVNEESSRSETSRHSRTSDRQDLAAWRWKAIARFDTEVSSYDYENSLRTTPLRVLRTADLAQVRIRLVSADYRHPVAQQPASGSEITFVFEATESPS